MAFASGVTYAEVPVDPRLAPYVQLIWTLDVDEAVSFGGAERILPDGIVEAIFHYRTPFRMRYRHRHFERQPASFVVSQTRSFIEIEPAGPSGFVSVRFYPWGAYHFFRAPIKEFANQMVNAADLWGQEAEFVPEQIANAGSARERVRLVQQFLLQQLHRNQKESVEALIRGVGSGRRRVTVRALCGDLGVSERSLERIFARTLGVSPKGYLRLRRFLHTCHLLRHCDQPLLTETAHRAGYYDQAHCIAEFRAFAGMTPGAFVTAEKAVFLDID